MMSYSGTVESDNKVNNLPLGSVAGPESKDPPGPGNSHDGGEKPTSQWQCPAQIK